MPWKIYFWIYLVLTLLGLPQLLSLLPVLNFAAWEGVFENIVLVLGLYSFVFKTQVFSKKTWRMIFYIILVAWILQLIYNLHLSSAIDSYLNFVDVQVFGLFAFLFSIIISIPALYSIYLLGFTSEKKIK
jgi:heme/copper-type cytochrome/quinol oxidase subunit 4